MIGIYKITSPIGKIYVGQTKDEKVRWRLYKTGQCQSQCLLFRSIVTYGAINHKFEIIEECDVSLLDERERYWQDEFRSCGPMGLNAVLSGGDNIDFEGMRNNRIKNEDFIVFNTQTGIFYDSVKEAAFSVNRKVNTIRGYLNGFRKNCTSLIVPGVTPNVFIPTTRFGVDKGKRAKIQMTGEYHMNNKPVESFDIKTGITVKRYYSAADASRTDGFKANTIASVIKGKLKSHRSLGWRRPEF